MLNRFFIVTGSVCLVLATGCSSAQKNRIKLTSLEGSRVALIEIKGEDMARRIAEVSLINQLVKKGTFELVNKKDLNRATTRVDVDAEDAVAVAQATKADHALVIDVVKFDADTKAGHDTEKVFDEQLAAERGEKEGYTERVYKVKEMNAEVEYKLHFTDAKTAHTRSGIAKASRRVRRDSREGAIRMPLKLGVLEKLSNQAFKDFFKEYQ